MPIISSLGPNQGLKNEDLRLLDAIQRSYLTANLVIALDVGDINSWNGSGQVWKDLSGSNNNFYLGFGTSNESSDPTFVGQVGNLTQNEYWRFNGGQCLTLATTPQPGTIQSIHKANSQFTLLCILFPSTGQAGNFGGIAGDSGNFTGNQAGFRWEIQPSGNIGFILNKASGGASGDAFVTNYSGPSNNTWSIIAVSFDAIANSFFGYENGDYSSGNSASPIIFTQPPSTSNAVSQLKIGDQGDGNDFIRSGSRIAGFAIWNRALAKNELDEIYTQIAPRWVGLPPAVLFPSFPSSNLQIAIVNPSGEFTGSGFQVDGATNTWISTVSTLKSLHNLFPSGDAINAHDGVLSFTGQLFTTETQAYQDVTIPPDWWNAIDTGHAKCNVNYWQVGTFGTNGSQPSPSLDQINVSIHFLDQNGTDLGSITTGNLHAADANSHTGSWTQQSLVGNIVSSSRTLRIYQTHLHTYNSIFAYDQLLDDFSPITLSVV